MFSNEIEGICFGPLKDYRGRVFAEEGEDTKGEFIQVPEADLMIRVDSHPAGGNARSTLKTHFGGRVHFSESDLPPGGAYFGHGGKGPAGLAFTHVKPA